MSGNHRCPASRSRRDYIGLGFNQDESRRKVFDGVLSQTGGAGRVFPDYEFGEPARTNTQHEDYLYPENAFPFSAAAMRAQLVALDERASRGVAPPDSRAPTIEAGTLVAPDNQGFPAIPDFAVARFGNEIALFGDWVRPRPEREAKGGPRRSLEERYGGHEAFVRQVRAAAAALVQARLLLAEDAGADAKWAQRAAVAKRFE